MLASILALVAAAAVEQMPGASGPPNVVVLLLDDTGYGDISYYKQPCQIDYQCPTEPTPNIDSVLTEGAVFTDFYSSHCVCSPSRAGLLTGRFPIRTGVFPSVYNPASIHGLPESEITIASFLSASKWNYKTHMIGKWHLGHLQQFNPASHGFDTFLGIPWSHDFCPCPCNLTNTEDCTCRDSEPGCPLYQNHVVVEQPAKLPYLTAQYTSFATDFINTKFSNEDSEPDPFFLYLAYQHSHHPQFHSPEFNTSKRGAYGDSMAELDHSIGLVMDAIKNDPKNNTIVFITSDNGASLIRTKFGGSAGQFRCGKGTTWEGGQRVVGGVWWPNNISPKVVKKVAANVDIFATVASLLGLKKPTDRIYDGQDLGPMIFSKNKEIPNSDDATMFYYGLNSKLAALRLGKYKAHWYSNAWGAFPDQARVCQNQTKGTQAHDPPLLFNLETSPNEDKPIDSSSSEYQRVMKLINAAKLKHNCDGSNNKHDECSNQFGPNNMWEADTKAEPWPPNPFHPYIPEYDPQDEPSANRIPYCGSQDDALEPDALECFDRSAGFRAWPHDDL